MSQQGILADLTTALSDVEKLTGDSGGAVTPDASHNINILGDDSTVNNANGITVVGDPGNNKLTVTLTNRATGQLTTTDATNQSLITLAAGGTAGCYHVTAYVTGFESTTPAGISYMLSNGIRTTGAAATLCGSTDKFVNEEAALAACQADIVVSGNDIILRVNGIGATNINWNAVLEYVFVS